MGAGAGGLPEILDPEPGGSGEVCLLCRVYRPGRGAPVPAPGQRRGQASPDQVVRRNPGKRLLALLRGGRSNSIESAESGKIASGYASLSLFLDMSINFFIKVNAFKILKLLRTF